MLLWFGVFCKLVFQIADLNFCFIKPSVYFFSFILFFSNIVFFISVFLWFLCLFNAVPVFTKFHEHFYNHFFELYVNCLNSFHLAFFSGNLFWGCFFVSLFYLPFCFCFYKLGRSTMIPIFVWWFYEIGGPWEPVAQYPWSLEVSVPGMFFVCALLLLACSCLWSTLRLEVLTTKSGIHLSRVW